VGRAWRKDIDRRDRGGSGGGWNIRDSEKIVQHAPPKTDKTFTMTLALTVSDCPSGHAYRTKFGLHKWKKKYKKELQGYENMAIKGHYFSEIKLVRWIDKKSKYYDRPNFAFGSKPIVDILVDKGLLKGDDPLTLRKEDYFQELDSSIKFCYIKITLSGLKKLEETK